MLENSPLNDAQRKAVTHGEGHLLVLAGPGSGKTHVITRRIFFLIQERGVRPEDILVVTFTRDAALSMQNRFTQQSENQIYPVNFGTFHSIFYHILQESQYLHGYKMIAENGKRELMLSVLRELCAGKENEGGCPPTAEDASAFLAAYSFAQNTGDPKLAEAKLPAKWRVFYRQAAQRYERAKRREKLFDFDDMVCLCKTLLEEDARARDYWQNRFSHILIDEFQDINPVQYEAMKLLAGRKSRLFAVGDDDQAIYGFRGSSPACLRRFAKEFDAGEVCLRVNYRSSQRIVEASLQVISENKERFAKALVAAKEGESVPVRIRPFEGPEEQYRYLAETLAGYPGEERERLAVLFRTNSDMQSFAIYLGKCGIPFFMREKVTSLYEHFIVQEIFAYLRLAAGEEREELLLRILNRPPRYLNREALGEGEGSPFQKLENYYRERENLPYRKERLRAAEKLRRDLLQMGRLPLYLRVQYLLKSVGYEAYLFKRAEGNLKRRQEWEEICEWAKREAKQYPDLKSWMEAAKTYRETLLQMRGENLPRTGGGERGEGNGDDAGRVQLLTVHASKGLEYDRVWIPNCNEGVYPHGRECDSATCEEERRVFYVAMTRAKKSLELLALTGTRNHPRLFSRFLNPLLADQASGSSSNSQLSKNSSNASATRSYSSSSSI
ncbi:MAG: ATP-dependent helicase [Candidatus Gastranaerophilales bacterium]|nr:ATP-dependent helicase [Candidatus Gastranaerophilales bacterium]